MARESLAAGLSFRAWRSGVSRVCRSGLVLLEEEIFTLSRPVHFCANSVKKPKKGSVPTSSAAPDGRALGGGWRDATAPGRAGRRRNNMHAGCSSLVLDLQLWQTIPSMLLVFCIFPVAAGYQNVPYVLCLSVLSPLSYPRAWGEGEKRTQEKEQCLPLICRDLCRGRSRGHRMVGLVSLPLLDFVAHLMILQLYWLWDVLLSSFYRQ